MEDSENEEEKIEAEEEKYTENMKKYTYLIENLIENEENKLTKLYESFKKLFLWVKKEAQNDSNTDLKNAALRQQILEECTLLRTEAEKGIVLLDTIKKSTQNEELTDDKKMNIKVRIDHHYEEQKDISKVVHYPKDIKSLTKEVIQLVQDGENLIRKDIDIEEKTKKFIDSFMDLTKRIHTQLDQIMIVIEKGGEISEIEADIKKLLSDIDQEIREFRELDKLERVHLQLLLKLHDEESDILKKEEKLNTAQKDYDLKEGLQQDQDGSVIFNAKK